MPVTHSEMIAVLRDLLRAKVWTGAEVRRRRVVLLAIVDLIRELDLP